MKKTIAIDFDGVLSAYTGWKGEMALDPPLPGAIDFLGRCLDYGFAVTIFTTRPEKLVSEWLEEHAGPVIALSVGITNLKPPAWLYIDDRCYLFKGQFPSVEEINAFTPYWAGPSGSEPKKTPM